MEEKVKQNVENIQETWWKNQGLPLGRLASAFIVDVVSVSSQFFPALPFPPADPSFMHSDSSVWFWPLCLLPMALPWIATAAESPFLCTTEIHGVVVVPHGSMCKI